MPEESVKGIRVVTGTLGSITLKVKSFEEQFAVNFAINFVNATKIYLINYSKHSSKGTV